MKIELIEEIKLNETPWYSIKIDGKYVKGTSVKQLAEEWYERVLYDVNALNTKENVLKSAEIDVSLKF